MSAWEYVFTPGVGDAVTLNTNTRSDEVGASCRTAFFIYCQVDGKDGIRLGKNGRVLNFLGMVHAASESALRTAMDLLSTAAANCEVGTLSVRGVTAAPWSNTIIAGPPVFNDHYSALDDGSVGVAVALRFEELVPGV